MGLRKPILFKSGTKFQGWNYTFMAPRRKNFDALVVRRRAFSKDGANESYYGALS